MCTFHFKKCVSSKSKTLFCCRHWMYFTSFAHGDINSFAHFKMGQTQQDLMESICEEGLINQFGRKKLAS